MWDRSANYKQKYFFELSLSLAYAQRINELGIDNVESSLYYWKKKFDIVECGGVLHHMESLTRIEKLSLFLKWIS